MKYVMTLGILILVCFVAKVSDARNNRFERERTQLHQFGIYLSQGSGHWMKSKTDDGAIVILEDGSVWQIDPLDQIDTMLWLPMTEITVVEIIGGYLLINTDDGEKAHARLVGR